MIVYHIFGQLLTKSYMFLVNFWFWIFRATRCWAGIPYIIEYIIEQHIYVRMTTHAHSSSLRGRLWTTIYLTDE